MTRHHLRRHSPIRHHRAAFELRSASEAEFSRLRIESLEDRVLLSGTSVTQYHDDSADNGLNATETVLTPGNVNSTDFGVLSSTPLNGNVYAQPLYVPNLTITVGPYTGVHNVVFAATENDSVYAIDSQSGTVLWQTSFINPAAGITAIPASDLPGDGISPNTGITSTPVIDPSTNTMYVETNTMDMVSGVAHFVQSLQAIDLGSGAEKFGGPTVIGDTTETNGVYTNTTNVTVNGTAPDAVNGVVSFNAMVSLQRSALELANGIVYMEFSSYNDEGPYHGWVIGYNASNLSLAAVWNDSPNGTQGGIWEAGAGLSVDSNGNMYLATGNGTFDTTLNSSGFPSQGDYGDSVLKLVPDSTTNAADQNVNGWGLKVVDYFTPSNEATLQNNDWDMGSSGMLLLPSSAGSAAHPNLLLVGNKAGTLYLIDTANMGKFDPNGDQIVQEVTGAFTSSVLDSPVFYNGTLYIGSSADYAKTFTISNAQISTTFTSESPDHYSYPGTNPEVSASGTTNGIVWGLDVGSDQLRAYAASDGYYDEIYTSAQAAGNRDALTGSLAHFVSPTVADGQVFVGTSDSLMIFGLLPNQQSGGATVNFNSLPVNVPGTTLSEPLTINGYNFTSTGNSAGNALTIQGQSASAWPGNWPTNVLMAAYWGTVINFTAAGGGPFNLAALDLGVNYQADSAIITGYSSTGTVLKQQTNNFTGNSSQDVVVTEDLNWTGVSKVTISWWAGTNGTGTQTFGAINNLYLGTKSTPTVTVSDAGGQYTGNPYPATALVNGQASLESVAPTLTYYSGSTASGTALTGAPSAVGTYTVVAGFAGSTDYTAAVSAPLTFTITPATTLVNFENLPVMAQGTWLSEPLVLSGYSFTSTGNQAGEGLMIQGPSGADWPGNWPSNVLMAIYWGTMQNVSAVGGGAFNLNSVDLDVNFQADSAMVTGYNAAGAAIDQQIVNFSGNASQNVTVTEALNWTGVSLVTFSWWSGLSGAGTQTFGAIDNLSLSQGQGTVGKTTPTLTVSDAGGTYTGSPFPATVLVNGSASLESVTPTLTYYSGTAATGSPLAGAPSTAGTYTVVASFAGSTDYATAVASTAFTIAQAVPTVTVSDAGGTFVGVAFPATATVDGDSSLEQVPLTFGYFSGTAATSAPLAGAPSTVGTYLVVASFASSVDYTTAAASTTFTITRAAPSLTVSDPGGQYTGSPFPATVLVNGQTSLESVTPTVTYYSGSSTSGTPLGGAPSAIGTYAVVASFAGSLDYTTAVSAPLTFTISSASTLINFENLPVNAAGTTLSEPLVISGYNFTSTGTSAGSGLMIQGQSGADWPGNWPSNVLMAAYWGSVQNITAASGTPFNLNALDLDVNYQADSAIVTGYGSTGVVIDQQVVNFTGNAAANVTVTRTLNWINVTRVTVSWWAASSGTGTQTFGAIDNLHLSQGTSSQVQPTLSVTDPGGTYSGNPLPASTLINGVASLEGVTPTLSYYSGSSASGTPSTTAPSLAGTYTAVSAFAGSADYTSATSSVTFSITRAVPTASVSDAGGVYSGSAFPATELVAGVGSQSTAAASLEGVTPSLAYYSGTSATGTPLGSAPSTVGTYTVAASFAGSTDYSSAIGSAAFSITRAAAALTVTDTSGTYTSSAFAATAKVAGVGSQSTAAASLEGVTPTLKYYSGTGASGTALSSTPSTVGTYTVAASFAGSTDYNSASASTTFSITKAVPVVTVTDAGGTATGAAYPATVKVAGVGSQSTPSTSLESVTPTVKYYSGTSGTGTALSSAPSAAGTYTAVGSFAGSTDYTSATGKVTFTISKTTGAVKAGNATKVNVAATEIGAATSNTGEAASQTAWQNPANPLDVIGSGGAVVPADALTLIDYLNSGNSTALPSTRPAGAPFLDVLGTGTVTPASVLAIIDYLNSHATPLAPAAIAVQPAATGGAASSLAAPAVDAVFAADPNESDAAEVPVPAAVQAVSSAPAPSPAPAATVAATAGVPADANAAASPKRRPN